MRFLIIEDDENKRNNMVSFIRERWPSSVWELARSYNSGLRSILEGGLDVVLLDMSLPMFDIGIGEPGGRTPSYGGRDILDQLARRQISLPVIVVTQFDRFGAGEDALTLSELDAQLRLQHSKNYRGAVYYSPSSEAWKRDLALLILGAEP